MRFGYRRTIIILVLAVAVVAVGASMLFAAPNADVERDEALKALAVLNRYFQNQPTPSLAPTPAHTPVPTDSPPTVSCSYPRDSAVGAGWFSRYINGEWVGYRVVEQVARHVQLTS